MLKKDLKEFDRIYSTKKDETKEEFTGFFDLRTPNFEGSLSTSDCMDGDFENRIFKDCLIFGADFASGCFNSCIFENVVFIRCAFVGVGFDDCSFRKVRFLNCQLSFSMGKCNTDDFGVSDYAFEDDALRQAKLILGWPAE